MKIDFLKLPSTERRLYIEQAAMQRNISPVLVEKDFFVCWLLSILFDSEFASSLVFKGGTSLSKIFSTINRFSEDIDLSLSPTFLGLPETSANCSQADKWRGRAEKVCEIAVQTQIMPMLEESTLGALEKNEQARFDCMGTSATLQNGAR
ncbi:MAG: hypothetical protein S4CHLAM2_13750 [Chlamydiales bacterium]|nr:hypothetical protein [Chlamydiales bacterium]